MEDPTSSGIGRPVVVLVVDGALVDSLTKKLKSYHLINYLFSVYKCYIQIKDQELAQKTSFRLIAHTSN